MEDESLASLTSGIVGKPKRIRALRRWNPRFQPYVTSYVFVDKFGVGIQAVVHGNKDQKYVESIIEIGKCYELDRYACTEPVKFINALSHEVNMRIGSATTITLLGDIQEIPQYYFNFCTYQKLIDICDNKNEITDYCGRLQGRIEDKSKKDGTPLVGFTLIDISGQPVQVTLWNDIAADKSRFDREAVENAEEPAIIAVTAMRVTGYLGRPTLQSTGNTFLFLNPQTQQTENLLNRFCRFYKGCWGAIWGWFEGCLNLTQILRLPVQHQTEE